MRSRQKDFPYFYQAEVVRWVDGDTVELIVDKGFYDFWGIEWAPITFRFLNVNAYEKYKPGGKEATAFVNELAPVGDFVIIRTFKVDEKDNFGRFLAELYTEELTFTFNAGPSVSEALIASGHAVPYVKK
jgi:endonuclease YncB( thermonuclease family)